jgi:hypothetical protein
MVYVTLFRIGVFGWLILIILDMLLAWFLYIFFKPVNKSVSLLAGWLGLAAATISGIAELNIVIVIVIVLSLISGADYLKAFDSTQLHAISLLIINTFEKIWAIGLFVFGCHLLLRGYLAFRTGFILRFLAYY